jgi:hypothetical protein
MSPRPAEGHGRRRVIQLAGCLDQLQQPFRGTGGALQVAPHLRQGGEAAADHRGVEHERGQLAAAHAAADDLAAAAVDQSREAADQHQDGTGDKQGSLADTRAGHGEGALHLRVEGLGLRGFAVKALHRADVLDDLTGVGADAGHRVLAARGQGAHPAAENHDRQQRQGHDRDDDQGQLETGDEHHDECPGQRQGAAQGHAHRRADDGLQYGRIRREPRHDLAGAVVLEKARVQAHEVPEHGAAQVRTDPFAEP